MGLARSRHFLAKIDQRLQIDAHSRKYPLLSRLGIKGTGCCNTHRAYRVKLGISLRRNNPIKLQGYTDVVLPYYEQDSKTTLPCFGFR